MSQACNSQAQNAEHCPSKPSDWRKKKSKKLLTTRRYSINGNNKQPAINLQTTIVFLPTTYQYVKVIT